MFLNQKIKDSVEGMGINVFWKNHVSSTNDYIKYQYIKDKTPILIMTNNQRNPRGRRGSLWVDYQLQYHKILLLEYYYNEAMIFLYHNL